MHYPAEGMTPLSGRHPRARKQCQCNVHIPTGFHFSVAAAHRCGEIFFGLGCGCPSDAPGRSHPAQGGVLNLPSDLSPGSDGWDDF